MKTVLRSLGVLVLLFSGVAFGADWLEWRGDDGMGIAATGTYPAEWAPKKNVAWRTEIPGRGWSTPVVVGNQVWMTAAFEVEASEEESKKRLEANTGNQPLTLLSELRLHAICVDRNSGKLLHNVELLKITDEPQWVHRLNSYASPSPVVADGRLYCHFGTFGNACLDLATTKVVWTNTHHNVMHENGPGSSPVVDDGRFIVHYDGSDAQFIVAIDAKTGKDLWKTKRSGELRSDGQLRKAYGTPIIVRVDGKKQVISPAADWVYAYDPATGKELWKLKYGILGFSNVSRPVAKDGMLYLATCFMRSEMLAIRLPTGGKSAEIVWRQRRSMPRMVSPILVDGYVYTVSDGGIMACLDVKTGEPAWRERLNGDFSASPIYAGGLLYVPARDGRMVMIKPGPTFERLRENRLQSEDVNEPEEIFASPVAVDGVIFIRTAKALYRIESGSNSGTSN